MHEVFLVLALLFGSCVGAAALFHRLKMPPMVGFLVVGALVGPKTFGLVSEDYVHLVESLAEVGVVVLLFTVGLELAPREVLRLRRAVVLGGGAQIGLTTLAGALVSWGFGLELGPAVFVGMLLTLSSTAAVTKLLSDRGEFAAPHGRLSVAICIAQDLAVVPMILALPLLAAAGGGGAAGGSLAEVFVETLATFGVLALGIALAVFLVPILLERVCRTRSREVFVLAVIALCLAMAAFTGELDMSLALGAFFAGMILAGTDFHHQAVSEIEPFRDALASLFFVSIGMLFDPGVLVDRPVLVVGALFAVVLGKALVVGVAARLVGLPGWLGVRAALTLAQVGEFSFLLVTLGKPQGLMGDELQKVFLVVAVCSIAITPLLYSLGRALARRRAGRPMAHKDDELSDHAVILGFGPVGQAAARALKAVDIPYRAVEMNPATVKAQKAAGEPIFLGDAAREVVLRAAAVHRCRLVVVAVADPSGARRAVELIRRIAPHAHVVARAIYLGEYEALQKVGADEVVPQELETSVEVLVRVLRHFLVAEDEVGRQAKSARDAVGARKVAPKAEGAGIEELFAEYLPGMTLLMVRVEHGAQVATKSLAESGIREATGCSVVALCKGERRIADPSAREILDAGDVAVVLGPESRVPSLSALFHAPVAPVVEPDRAGSDHE